MKEQDKNLFAQMLGNRIAEVRGRTSQIQFAKDMGVGKNSYIRYEKGDVVPDAFFIARLCDKFDLNLVWLLFGVGERRGGPTLDKRESCHHDCPLQRKGHIIETMPGLEPGLMAFIMKRLEMDNSMVLRKEQEIDAAFLAYIFCQTGNTQLGHVICRIISTWSGLSEQEKEEHLTGT